MQRYGRNSWRFIEVLLGRILAAGIAQLVEHLLAMQKVASSSLVSRSTHSSAHTLSLVFDFAGTNSLITVR